jgi:hypothetical protein
MLKYLFTASFRDGKIYQQNEEDISVVDPSKSCFFDILEEEKTGNQIDLFCLCDGEKD